MKYRHHFRVNQPAGRVAEFHQRAESLAAITPPPIRMRIDQAPDRLDEGGEMRFALLVGPLPVPWHARIESVSSSGFTDRQISGPFRHWTHRHSFLPAGPEETQVVDEIEAGLRLHPIWGLVGLGMWVSLPLLFAYRGWKTRRLIEGERRGPG